MNKRQLRTLKFATAQNIDDLVFYLLYSNSDIFTRVSTVDGWLQSSHMVRVDLANTVAKWDETSSDKTKRHNLAKRAEQLNLWRQRNVNRQGHVLINNSFSKWQSAAKVKYKKIAISANIHQQLSVLKQHFGYDSLDEVLQHYLPDAVQMQLISQAHLTQLAEPQPTTTTTKATNRATSTANNKVSKTGQD